MVEAATSKAYFWGRLSGQPFRGGTWNMPTLSDLVQQGDTLERIRLPPPPPNNLGLLPHLDVKTSVHRVVLGTGCVCVWLISWQHQFAKDNTANFSFLWSKVVVPSRRVVPATPQQVTCLSNDTTTGMIQTSSKGWQWHISQGKPRASPVRAGLVSPVVPFKRQLI